MKIRIFQLWKVIEIGINKPFPIDLVGVVSEIAKPQNPKIDKINIKHLTKLHAVSKNKNPIPIIWNPKLHNEWMIPCLFSLAVSRQFFQNTVSLVSPTTLTLFYMEGIKSISPDWLSYTNLCGMLWMDWFFMTLFLSILERSWEGHFWNFFLHELSNFNPSKFEII